MKKSKNQPNIFFEFSSCSAIRPAIDKSILGGIINYFSQNCIPKDEKEKTWKSMRLYNNFNLIVGNNGL